MPHSLLNLLLIVHIVHAKLEELEKLSGPVLFKTWQSLVEVACKSKTYEEKQKRVHEGIREHLAKAGLELSSGTVLTWVPYLCEADNVGIIFKEVYGEKCWDKVKKELGARGAEKELLELEALESVENKQKRDMKKEGNIFHHF